MNVLVIGNGGREHALCYGIKQSPNCSNLYCIPGSDSCLLYTSDAADE